MTLISRYLLPRNERCNYVRCRNDNTNAIPIFLIQIPANVASLATVILLSHQTAGWGVPPAILLPVGEFPMTLSVTNCNRPQNKSYPTVCYPREKPWVFFVQFFRASWQKILRFLQMDCWKSARQFQTMRIFQATVLQSYTVKRE